MSSQASHRHIVYCLQRVINMKKIAIIVAVICLALPAVAKPKAEIKSQWQGARVAYLGDSITDIRQPQKYNTDPYWVYLESLLGIKPFVYGISGHQWHQIPGQTDKLIAEHGQEVDAIMIFVGINDYNANVPLGDWFTEEVVEVEVSGRKGMKSGVMAQRKKRPWLWITTPCVVVSISQWRS